MEFRFSSSTLRMALACFLAFALTMELASAESRRYFCQKHSDCDPGECCVMGMQRYTLPRCQKHGQLGDYCRMGNVPEDKTLYFPNGISFHASSVYTLFCPCDEGLTCRGATCQKGEGEEVSNDLFDNLQE